MESFALADSDFYQTWLLEGLGNYAKGRGRAAFGKAADIVFGAVEKAEIVPLDEGILRVFATLNEDNQAAFEKAVCGAKINMTERRDVSDPEQTFALAVLDAIDRSIHPRGKKISSAGFLQTADKEPVHAAFVL